MSVMRRLVEKESDVGIAQQAPRTFRERESLRQIFHRELQWMRRVQLRNAGVDSLECQDGFKECPSSWVPGCHDFLGCPAYKIVEGQRSKAA